MSAQPDWIPHGVKEFDDFQKTFIDLTETNETDWGLDHDKRVALKALGTTYSDFYTISKNKASARPLDYENTHNARIPYIKGIRVFTKEEIKFNSKMSNTDRTSIQVPNDAGTHTAAPIATEGPIMWFDNSHHALLFIHFGPVSGKEAKPEGQAEMVMAYEFYKVGDPIPGLSACTHHTTFTNSAGHLDTDDAHFGMMMVAYGYWKNTRNELGPPSIAYTVLVS